MDFARKFFGFEAGCQEDLKGGTRVLASRAKLLYLAAWLLGDSSLGCLATWPMCRYIGDRIDGWAVYRQIGSSSSWLVGSAVSHNMATWPFTGELLDALSVKRRLR